MSSASDGDKSPLTGQPWWPLIAILLGILGISNLRPANQTSNSAKNASASTTQLSPHGKAVSIKGTGDFRLLTPLVDFLCQEGLVEKQSEPTRFEQFRSLFLPSLLASPSKPPPNNHEECDREPVEQIVDHAATGQFPGSSKELVTKLPQQSVPRRYPVETMIVDVPDPVESSVGYQFDIVVESLQAAMSREGFVPDRYYLPWQEYRARLAADPKRTADREERIYINQPGVLLFRSANEDRLVLVFLIGESPISGIHKAAFDAAAEAILSGMSELHRRRPGLRFTYEPPRHLRVLGPFFSGGADSLALAISRVCKRHGTWTFGGPSFRVLSGSALNVDKDDFEELCGGPQCALFQTTTVMKELLEHELITYASDPLSFRKTPEPDERTTAKPDGRKMDAPRNPTRPGHSVRIAWLTESDTDFGLVDPMQDTSGRNLSDKSSSRLGVEFPFPIHISRVRAAFTTAHNAAKQEAPILNFNRFKLSIPFDDAEEPRDVVPEFSPGLTPPTVELLLSRILMGISKGHFDFVGISATDARDTIFLAGLLKEYCPDAQLLIVGSDPLYTHPQAQTFLRGALVASAYPMSGAGQEQAADLARGDQTHLEFASDDCQGVYNAATILRHYEALDANPDQLIHRWLPSLRKLLSDRSVKLFQHARTSDNDAVAESQPPARSATTTKSS